MGDDLRVPLPADRTSAQGDARAARHHRGQGAPGGRWRPGRGAQPGHRQPQQRTRHRGGGRHLHPGQRRAADILVGDHDTAPSGGMPRPGGVPPVPPRRPTDGGAEYPYLRASGGSRWRDEESTSAAPGMAPTQIRSAPIRCRSSTAGSAGRWSWSATSPPRRPTRTSWSASPGGRARPAQPAHASTAGPRRCWRTCAGPTTRRPRGRDGPAHPGGVARCARSISDLLAHTTARDPSLRCESTSLQQPGPAHRHHRATPAASAAAAQPRRPLGRVGRPVLVRQVLDNLIGNAIKYTAPGVIPRIAISAERLGDGVVRVEVTDNGIGIPRRPARADLRQLPPGAPRRRLPGTGLGLAICKRIVERHGGTITASDNPTAAAPASRSPCPRTRRRSPPPRRA